MDPKTLLDQLISILEAEKSDLLSGRYDRLSDLSAAKESRLGELETWLETPAIIELIKPYKDKVVTINKFAAENESLLNNVRSGIQAAQERLKKVKQEEGLVGTYTQYGDKLQFQESIITRRKIA